MNKIILGILSLLLIAGCTTTVSNCPNPIELECPVCPAIPEPVDNLLHVYYLNVGEGASTLIKQGSTEMLIDCGKNTAGLDIVNFLKDKKVDTLDYLLMTNGDSDHTGGCDDILQYIPTKMVISNGIPKDTVTYREVISQIDTETSVIAKEGDSWSIGPYNIQVVQSIKDKTDDDNYNTIVTRLEAGSVSFLFTGDCDKECETILLTKNISATILQVPHHGSKFGTSLHFLNLVMPTIAVIPVGDNSYGHPAEETTDRLSQEGIMIYRTDVSGNIEITTNGISYEVK